MGKKKSSKSPAFVLDCSVTVAWFFPDEVSAYAAEIRDSLAGAAAFVPSLWPLEVANALVVGERRKRATEAKSTQFLVLLSALPINIDEETTNRAWSDTIKLARAHNLSVYDAAYLELAIRRGLSLASIDKGLKSAAAAVGVPLHVP
jgi:predicted nucleic acid-binding protein